MLKYKKFVWPLIIAAFILQGVVFLDPDFGWHLRNGRELIDARIFRADPYTYTMPTFYVISHEWLIDILWFVLYPFIGSFGLILLWVLVAVVALFIAREDKGRFSLLPIVLTVGAVFPFFGLRPQIVSWLFLAVLLKVLKHKANFWKLLGIFLLWSNAHGSFASGIAVLWIYFLVELVQSRKLVLAKLFQKVILTLVTLINPFGIEIWREVFSSVLDTQLRWRIDEWKPAFLNLNLPFLIFVCLSFALIWHYRKKLQIVDIVVYLAFLVLSIASVRHIPLWCIVALPLTTQGFALLYKDAKIKKGAKRFSLAYRYFTILVLIFVLFFTSLLFRSNRSKSELEKSLVPSTIFT